MGFTWGLRWERICLQCRRPRFEPWVGKIPWRSEVCVPGEFHKLLSKKHSPSSRWCRKYFFFSCSRKLFFPDYRTSESSLPQPERQCLLTAQIWCTDTLYKAPVLSHTTRGQEQREWILSGDLLFVWNLIYLATLLGPGSGRGSVGMKWWRTSRSQPAVVKREWFSADQVASLTKFLWAWLLNLWKF